MESVTHQGMQPLAQRLQQQLNSLPQSIPFQVQCAVKQGNLIVLSQHSPDQMPEPKQVFERLQHTIQALPLDERIKAESIAAQPSDALNDRFLVKLYLRVAGQKQPYAFHALEWRSTSDLADASTDAETVNSSQSSQSSQIIQPQPKPIAPYLSTQQLVAHAADDASTLALEDEPSVSVPIRRRRSNLPWLVLGAASGAVVLIAGLLALTRPCVVGQCKPLETAQALNQQSTQLMQAATSEQNLQQAQQQLAEADRLLGSIPPWSLRHGEAKALQQRYQPQTAELNQVLGATNTAKTAAQKSQTLPQSVADWQSIQALWQTAIAQLQAIPPSSSLYPFAQQRLVMDQQNLARVNQNITAEQQAQKQLKAAKATATIAEARQGVAQSLESWQQARVTWQVAVNALGQIPKGTTSYSEAQEFLKNYEQKLATARDRVTQEQTSQKTYAQAEAFARRAERFQKQNQWFQAVTAWRDALTYARQVPNETLYYGEAQPKIADYTNRLKSAETQLQAVTALQKIRAELRQVCAGSPQICTYTIARDAIQVQLTSTYERAVRTAFAVGRAGDNGTLGGVSNHLDTLETAFQTIATNAGLPLVVHNADGSEIIGAFNPNRQ